MNKILLIVALTSLTCGLISAGPLHASCKVGWLWPATDCTQVKAKIVAQMNAWQTADNCKNGGEKCLYAITDQSGLQLKDTHTTTTKNKK